MPVDLPAVGRFLQQTLNPRVPAAVWARAVDVPWPVDAPNRGFLARQDDAVVGAYLAYYSVRPVGGVTEQICNLGAWSVLEEHRFQGLRLLRALLAQNEWQFTDLSPSGNVVPLNRKLGFLDLDTATAVLPNRPWAQRGVTTTSAPELLEDSLTGPELRVYRDHRDASAAHHVLLRSGSDVCHVIVRRDRRKGANAFASVLYASDPELLRGCAPALGRHLLLHLGVPATLVELRIARGTPQGTATVRPGRPKMYHGDRLAADDVDYLYSELTCLPW
jgi:hypothetical protein